MDKKITQLKYYLKNLDPQKLELARINTDKIKITEMTRGGYNINYLVIIDTHKFVFRLNIYKSLDINHQTKYEYEILKCLEGKNIAPKAYFVDTSKKGLEYDLLVEEFIENKKLKFNNRFLQDFGKLLRKLHSLKVPETKLLIKQKNPLSDQWKFIKDKINFIKVGNYNQKFLDFISPYLPKIDNYVSEYVDFFNSKDICLNHRDLVIENVLQTNQGLRLVDWEVAMADDPSYDLAYFLCDTVSNWSLGRPLLEQEKQIFLKFYGVNDDLFKKIEIRLPMVYLELFVWLAYRVAYLKNKLKKNLVQDSDKNLIQKRIKDYEKFLKEKKMIKFLKTFHHFSI